MKLSIRALSLSVVIVAAPVAAQVGWQSLTPNTIPASRGGHKLVFAGPFGGVLFGGQAGSTYYNDTWSWNGSDWTLQSPAASPSRRGHFAMAYDPTRNRVVLFSGWDGNRYPADTWEYDGTTWTQMSPAASPPGRDWAAMEYDPISQKIILFGGHDWQRSTAGLPNYADTWAWDGAAWTQLQPANSPSHRWGHVMVQHGALGATILHGGTAGSDTWLWTGTDWAPLSTANAPSTRTRPGIGYDPLRGRTVLFGGVAGGVIQSDTWEFDGTNWTQRSPTGNTPPVSDTSGIFDPIRREVVNFGGSLLPNRSSTSMATDSYGPLSPATARSFGSGCAGVNGVPQMDTARLAWAGATYDTGVFNAIPNAGVFFLVGFSNQRTSAGLSLPLALDPIGMVGCSLLVDPAAVGFGTVNGGGEARFQLTVPAQASLVGAPVYSQAIFRSAGSNALGLVASNGAEHVVGGL